MDPDEQIEKRHWIAYFDATQGRIIGDKKGCMLQVKLYPRSLSDLRLRSETAAVGS